MSSFVAFYCTERCTEEEGLAQAPLSWQTFRTHGRDRKPDLRGLAVLRGLHARRTHGCESRLGSNDAKRAQPLSSFDADRTPTLSYELGPVARLALVGPLVVRRPGVLAMLGLGRAL